MDDSTLLLMCAFALAMAMILFYIDEKMSQKAYEEEGKRIYEADKIAHQKIDEEYNEKIRKIEEREKEDLARIDSVLNEARELVEKMKNEMENKK